MGHLTLGIVLQADMSHTERLSEINTPFQKAVSEYFTIGLQLKIIN